MKEQNYKNHSQVVYGYYLLTGVPIILLMVLSVIKIFNAANSERQWGFMFLLVGWILLTMLFRSRRFAIIAQDRAIRAEENLRHLALTGKLLDTRLTLPQVISLRFASDEEFVTLAQRAVSENWSKDEIKKNIKNWRPDFHRV
jgi:hypothetical protein